MKGKQLEGMFYLNVGTTVFKNYKIMEKIGTGAFGEIYKAESQNNSGQLFAIKTEPVSTRHPQLVFEAKLYKYLHSDGSF